MSKILSKCPQVTIRVSVDDKNLIKEFGGNYADIWRLGFEKWLENIPSELQKKAEYYQNLLLQCNNKIAQCNNIVITRNEVLDEICKEYIEHRDVDNPTEQDKYWIKCKIQDRSLKISVNNFLNRCKELKEGGRFD